MNYEVISYVVNGLLLLLGWFMKQSYGGLKEDNKDLWREITLIKDNYFKREEFTEFKQELWHRLDDFKKDVKDQIRELKE